MGRLLIIIVVMLGLVGGGRALLAGRNSERAQTRVEKVVPLGSLQK